MPKHVYRDDVHRMANERAQIVDVLPRDEYEESHIPGAINIPLIRVESRNGGPAPASCAGDLLLPRLPVRHEPAGRVAARRLRIREGLRLRSRKGGLVRQRSPTEGTLARSYHRRRGTAGRADLRAGGED